MKLNTKNQRKPVQAGDYGKSTVKPCENIKKSTSTDTDGRKTLSLWSY